jgi:hypothetical protein
MRSQDSSVDTVIDYGAEEPRFSSWQRQGIFLSCIASKVVHGPTQPIQWVPGIFPQGSSGRGVKLTTHLHLELRLQI